MGNPQALSAGVISAGIAQQGGAPDQGAESRVEEPGRETSEHGQFAVPTGS
jgi:hypothetical protein